MTDLLSTSQAEALRARLDDPAVAAALNSLLDNIDVLALAAESISGLLQRGDTITDSLASGLRELGGVRSTASFLAEPTKRLVNEAPEIADAATALLDSGMLRREVVEQLGRFAGAAVEGVQNAERNGTQLKGIRSTLHVLKDPDVAKGMGLLIEVARSIGKTL